MSSFEVALCDVRDTCDDLVTCCRRVVDIDNKERNILTQLTGSVNHLRSQLQAQRNSRRGRMITGLVQLADRFRGKRSL